MKKCKAFRASTYMAENLYTLADKIETFMNENDIEIIKLGYSSCCNEDDSYYSALLIYDDRQ